VQRISGILNQSLSIESDTEVDGIVNGTITVRRGCHVRLGGMVKGDVIVEPGARLDLTGMVSGRIVNI
jgi:cytoskeletal protein CcmA (bactofilin family)